MEDTLLKKKLEDIRLYMRSNFLDCFIVINYESSSRSTSRFLTGFQGTFCIIFISQEDFDFYTDSRYLEYVEYGYKSLNVKIYDGNLIQLLKKLLSAFKPGAKIGYEASNISVRFYKRFFEVFKNFSFVGCEDIFLSLRTKKNASEIDNIKKAVIISEKSYLESIERFEYGMSEKDFSALLEYRMRINGADSCAFETIVASGKRSCMPHGYASDKKIEKGDIVIVDFGACFNGLNSDITRVFCVNKLDPRHKKAYDVILSAQNQAIEASRPGMLSSDLDGVARGIIKKYGLSSYFTHTLGHGVGYDVHEEPKISKNSSYILESGNVFTIEPGVYFPGDFGVRVEDTILLTEKGHQNFCSLTKEIIKL